MDPQNKTDSRPPIVGTSSRFNDLMKDLGKGDERAPANLLPLVYEELRHLAAHYMLGERAGQTIQPTELVHEAYMRLAGNNRLEWQGLSHFKAIAAISMRRVLIERARHKAAEKCGGAEERIELNEALAVVPERPNGLLALDEALTRLAQFSPRQSRVVEMRFFGGLTVEEIAEVEHVSARTVKEDWSLSRAWLHKELAKKS